MSSKKVPPRKEVLDSLIDEILEIAEAKRYGLDVPDSQVDNSYNTVATRMGIDAQKLTQLLVAGGASDDTLKRRLRAQIAWTNLGARALQGKPGNQGQGRRSAASAAQDRR